MGWERKRLGGEPNSPLHQVEGGGFQAKLGTTPSLKHTSQAGEPDPTLGRLESSLGEDQWLHSLLDA